MTEQEYINVRELSSVLDAKMILRDIVVANSKVISKEDHSTVLHILSKWEDGLFELAKIDCK